MTFVALITGASSGIGEATARLLVQRRPDANIVLVARRRDRVDALGAELNAGAPRKRAYPYAADLTDPEAIAALVSYVESHFGQLNLLVNNAGARWSQTFSEGGYANVAQTMAINFNAQVQLTESLLGLLRRAVANAGGPAAVTPAGAPPAAAIVNVASTAARVSRPGTGAYSASKAALVGWSDAIHYELGAEGIHVGLLNPGFIATEGFPQAELRADPLKRLIVSTPEKAAEAVLAAAGASGSRPRAEVFVPGYYWLAAAARIVTPALIRRAVGGGSFNTHTTQDPG